MRPWLDRFMAKVDKAESGCWLWTSALNNRGYGRFGLEGKMRLAHRLSYETFVGTIPAGLDLDHLCGVRSCVNPAHLEPVTHRENLRRGSGFAGENSRKSHCAHGHPLSGDNLYEHPTNGRYCRACKRRWDAEARARKRLTVEHFAASASGASA